MKEIILEREVKLKKTTYISMEDILNLKKENDFETICERFLEKEEIKDIL